MFAVPIPEKLEEILEIFEMTSDRSEKSEMLIYWAEKFKEVPQDIAKRPFDEKNRVPSCESQAFVFYKENDQGLLDFHFAVENPQGISAKAICALMKETLDGAHKEEILEIDPDLVFTLFDRSHLGMARAAGLRGIIKMIKIFTKNHFDAIQ